MVAAFSGLCLATVVWGEYFDLLPHVEMPFIESALNLNLTFVAVRFGWQMAVLGGTATVAMLMTGALRKRERELAAASIVDDKTGLYDRGYFLRALGSEVTRNERDERPLGVILADIDDFDRFNKLFGFERGDRMLRSVARGMTEAVQRCAGGTLCEANIISRYGGEEFAIILAEGTGGQPPTRGDLLDVAEAIRVATADVRVEDAGVTVSVGVARYPEDGHSIDELLDSADAALNRASAGGGNRVVAFGPDA